MTQAENWQQIEDKINLLLKAGEQFFEKDNMDLLAELNYHGEPGVALEMTVAGFRETGGWLTAEQADIVADLVRTMEMDESIAAEARSLVR